MEYAIFYSTVALLVPLLIVVVAAFTEGLPHELRRARVRWAGLMLFLAGVPEVLSLLVLADVLPAWDLVRLVTLGLLAILLLAVGAVLSHKMVED